MSAGRSAPSESVRSQTLAECFQAALSKDIAVVQGISLVIVAVFVIVNAIVDFLYATLDPRVSLGTSAS